MNRALAVSLCLVVLAACTDQAPIDRLESESPHFAVSDGATGGNPDFFFLPPARPNPVRNPEFEREEFNPNLLPAVRICPEGDLVGGTCPVPGAVEAQAELIDDHYQFDWQTSRGTVGVYRVEVFVGTTRLGFFDAQLVRTGRDRRSVPSDNVPVVAGSTLPVSFHIENGALCDPPGVEPCASETVDLTEGGEVTLETGSGVDIPSQEKTDQVTTVTVQLCDDLNPRLLDLPTFGECLTITADPPLEDDLDVAAIVSVCTLDLGMLGLSEDQEDLVTLHRVDPGPVVTALPHADDSCDQNLGSTGNGPVNLALAGARRLWNQVAGHVGPRPLLANSATVVLDRGGGGSTLTFSDFQFALPAKIAKVAGDNQTAEPGTAVDVPPKVLVEDANGDPVAGATVRFAVASGSGTVDGGQTSVPVITGADGTAAVLEWVLGATPGTNTLEASGRGLGVQAPFMPDIGLPTDQQQPVDLVLPPNPVVFTAEAAGEIGFEYESDGWKFFLVTPESENGIPAGFEDPAFDDSEWNKGPAPFWDDPSPSTDCDLTEAQKPEGGTTWPAASVNAVSADKASHILLRKRFFVPSDATGITIGIAIDNDVRVFLNGTELTDGFLEREGCPTLDSILFEVNAADLDLGALNLLALHGRDRGVISYVDARVTVEFDEPIP